MITTSEQTDKLDAALAKALAMVSGLERSAKNDFTKSKYPNLEDVWKVLRPALRDHGISVTQHPFKADDKHIGLETRVAIDGQWIKSELVMPVTKWDPQGWGAGLTYAKRYALSAIFGLAEDDDDGNMASGRGLGAPETRPFASGDHGQASKPPKRVMAANQQEADATGLPFGKAPQKAVKRDDWEIKARCHAEGIDFDQYMAEQDAFLTDAAKAEPNEHASYVIRMGKNAGKRIDQVGEPGLRDFIKWVESRTSSGQTVAPLVTEYYEHATAYLR